MSDDIVHENRRHHAPTMGLNNREILWVVSMYVTVNRHLCLHQNYRKNSSPVSYTHLTLPTNREV